MLSSRYSPISLLAAIFLTLPFLCSAQDLDTVFVPTFQSNLYQNNGVCPMDIYTFSRPDFIPLDTVSGKPMAIAAFAGGDTVVTANTNKGKFTKFPIASASHPTFTSPCGLLPQDVKVWEDPYGYQRILISAAGIDSLQAFASNGAWLHQTYPGDYPMGMGLGIYHAGQEVVFVACRDSRTVAVVDLLTFEVIDIYDQVGRFCQ